MTRSEILGDVWVERERQQSKFGPQRRTSGTWVGFKATADNYRRLCDLMEAQGGASWFAILMEEVYEAAAEEDKTRMRAELVQVAAVAVAWIENLDNGVA